MSDPTPETLLNILIQLLTTEPGLVVHATARVEGSAAKDALRGMAAELVSRAHTAASNGASAVGEDLLNVAESLVRLCDRTTRPWFTVTEERELRNWRPYFWPPPSQQGRLSRPNPGTF